MLHKKKYVNLMYGAFIGHGWEIMRTSTTIQFIFCQPTPLDGEAGGANTTIYRADTAPNSSRSKANISRHRSHPIDGEKAF